MLQTSPVVIVRDPGDPVAAAMPVAWAESQLVEALAARSVPAMFWQTLEQVPTDAACVVLSGLAAPIALAALESNGLRAANVAEEVALLPAHQTGQDVTVAAGSDARGLMYATLELADRVATAVGDPLAALRIEQAVIQQPANPIRGVARLFTSDVEDLSWFHITPSGHVICQTWQGSASTGSIWHSA